MHDSAKKIVRDVYILCICIIVTIVIVKTGFADELLQKVQYYPILVSFFAGIFFTSIFTLSASAVVLINIAQGTDPLMVAFVGACGALIGDLALFAIVKNKITKNVDTFIQKASHGHPLKIFRLEFLKWLNPILGAIIIASPLPDELGLALLGFSNLRPQTLAAILFFMNGIGIYILLSLAQVSS